MEEEGSKIKAVGQQQQGSWTTWEAVIRRYVENTSSKAELPHPGHIRHPSQSPESSHLGWHRGDVPPLQLQQPKFAAHSVWMQGGTDAGPVQVSP